MHRAHTDISANAAACFYKFDSLLYKIAQITSKQPVHIFFARFQGRAPIVIVCNFSIALAISSFMLGQLPRIAIDNVAEAQRANYSKGEYEGMRAALDRISATCHQGVIAATL